MIIIIITVLPESVLALLRGELVKRLGLVFAQKGLMVVLEALVVFLRRPEQLRVLEDDSVLPQRRFTVHRRPGAQEDRAHEAQRVHGRMLLVPETQAWDSAPHNAPSGLWSTVPVAAPLHPELSLSLSLSLLRQHTNPDRHTAPLGSHTLRTHVHRCDFFGEVNPVPPFFLP